MGPIAGLLVVLTALLTREVGGGRAAQVLAGSVVAVSPVVTGASHLLSTTTFDLPAWALLCLILLSPLLGAALGAAGGALGGRLSDVGINDQFMRDVAKSLDSGHAALFLLIRKMTADKVLNEALVTFTLDVTATREQEIAGVCLVTMMLQPTFSIDYIKVIMNLS